MGQSTQDMQSCVHVMRSHVVMHVMRVHVRVYVCMHVVCGHVRARVSACNMQSCECESMYM
jgi:hypothetical protein